MPVYEDDGDAEPLVKDARPRRGRAKKAIQNEDDFLMGGGLGNRDSDEIATAQSEAPTTTDELSKDDGPPPATKKATKRPARGMKPTVQGKAPSMTPNGPKTRLQAPAHKAVSSKRSRDLPDDEIVVSSSEAITEPRAARRSKQSKIERSDFSLSPSPPPPGNLKSVKRPSLAQPGSALRMSGTPAVESSILALRNFKRRPRQGSMLQMVQQRTASARPSAIKSNTIAHADDLDIESAGLEDEETFAPDAEGTPVLKKATKPVAGKGANTKTLSSSVAPTSAQTRKRKSDETENSLSALDALRAKRQRQSQAGVEDLLPISKKSATVGRSSSISRRTPPLDSTSDVQVINSSSSTPLTDPPSPQPLENSQEPDAVVPSTEKEQDYTATHVPALDLDDELDIPNGTMADPISSSPPHSSPPPHSIQQTDIMADPRTQISPPRLKLRDKKTEKKAKPLDTATLQALLPKRRKPLQQRQRQSEYDFDSQSEEDDGPIDTSHLNEDDDELSGRARRQTKPATGSTARKSTAAKSRKSKAAPLSRKSTAQSKARKSKAGRAPSRTYGRGTASDKENEDDFEDVDNEDSILPDTSISMHEAKQSAELEALRNKFAALDEEEMEFENVEVEEGRSSSQLWR